MYFARAVEICVGVCLYEIFALWRKVSLCSFSATFWLVNNPHQHFCPREENLHYVLCYACSNNTSSNKRSALEIVVESQKDGLHPRCEPHSALAAVPNKLCRLCCPIYYTFTSNELRRVHERTSIPARHKRAAHISQRASRQRERILMRKCMCDDDNRFYVHTCASRVRNITLDASNARVLCSGITVWSFLCGACRMCWSVACTSVSPNNACGACACPGSNCTAICRPLYVNNVFRRCRTDETECIDEFRTHYEWSARRRLCRCRHGMRKLFNNSLTRA